MINIENINFSKNEKIIEQFKHIQNEDNLPYFDMEQIKNILREDD